MADEPHTDVSRFSRNAEASNVKMDSGFRRNDGEQDSGLRRNDESWIPASARMTEPTPSPPNPPPEPNP